MELNPTGFQLLSSSHTLTGKGEGARVWSADGQREARYLALPPSCALQAGLSQGVPGWEGGRQPTASRQSGPFHMMFLARLWGGLRRLGALLGGSK